MKFEKLNLDAFSKEELTDNMLRSVNGGTKDTQLPGPYQSTRFDFEDKHGETTIIGQDHTECDNPDA